MRDGAENRYSFNSRADVKHSHDAQSQRERRGLSAQNKEAKSNIAQDKQSVYQDTYDDYEDYAENVS
jgi:hypothetical protein